MRKKSRARNPGWFPKGRSGNLKGRPRSFRGPTGSAFEVLVEKTLTVPDRGGTREITLEEALEQQTYQDALARKRMAMREVMKWIIEREAWLAKHERKAPEPMPLRISPDPDNADAAVALTAADLNAIDSAMAGIEVKGARYTDAMERMSGVEAPSAVTQ
jgi:hypothetical protein